MHLSVFAGVTQTYIGYCLPAKSCGEEEEEGEEEGGEEEGNEDPTASINVCTIPSPHVQLSSEIHGTLVEIGLLTQFIPLGH